MPTKTPTRVRSARRDVPNVVAGRQDGGACWCILLVLTLILLLSTAAPAAAELPAIMVLNIKHEEDAGPGIAKILTELVLQDLTDLKRFRVIGEKDVNQMLNTEQQKQLAGCTGTSCLVELAGAMGTQYTLDGTVGAVGQSSVLSLSLIDVTKAAVVSRKTAVVKGEREQLLESVHKLIAELMAPVLDSARVAGVGAAEAKRNPPVSGPHPPGARKDNDQKQTAVKTVEPGPPMNPYKLWGHVSFWSGLGVVGLGGVFTGLAAGAADDFAAGGMDPVGKRDAIGRNNALAVTCYTLGGALVATGVTLWVLSPGDEAWAKGQKLALIPSVAPGGALMVMTGRW
ncbi:MAG: hypothetical protein HY897_21970 [Deltaproteobacteria bacterium]|nr:hypothetical protein [Deltaproteobacteria bacterium]